MDNYQLYRTNIALGGQMKWNLVLETGLNNSNVSELFVNNFHLSPISDAVSYTKPQNNLLNNSHLYNIKEYFNYMGGSSFYNAIEDKNISSAIPLLLENDVFDGEKLNPNKRSQWPKIIDDQYMCGLKRSSYKRYHKQFEYFCPIWLEELKDNEYLSFKFSIKTKTASGYAYNDITSKTVTFKPDTRYDFHNKFANYLNEYIKSIYLDGRLLNINLDNQNSHISGVDVLNGTFVRDIQLLNLVNRLADSELLLMDADNTILKSFEQNHLISKQLFNFNFIFDIDEFFSPSLLNMMYGQDFRIDVQVYINSETDGKSVKSTLLDKKDFHTNYDFIKCERVGSVNASGKDDPVVNVFDIIKDNKNINLTRKNKICQNIFHWALSTEDEYIFNIYTGFGGYTAPSLEKITKTLTIQADELDDIKKSSIVINLNRNYDWFDIHKYIRLIGSIDLDNITISNNYSSSGPTKYITTCGRLKAIVKKDQSELSDIDDNAACVITATTIKSGVSIKVDIENTNIKVDRTSYTYQNSVDVWTETYKDGINNIGWCKSYVVKSKEDFLSFISDYATEYLNNIELIGGEWCNGVHFSKPIENPFKAVMIIYEPGLRGLIPMICDDAKEVIKNSGIEAGKIVGLVNVLFVPNTPNGLSQVTFRKMQSLFNVKNESLELLKGTWLYDLKDWFPSATNPSIISTYMLGYIRANRPDRNAEELTHVNTHTVGRISRYGGNIHPCFVDPEKNNVYIKKVLNKNNLTEDTPEIKYMNDKYPTVYPSIQYYPWYYKDLVSHPTDNTILIANTNIDECFQYEWKFYGDNNHYVLYKTPILHLQNYDIIDSKVAVNQNYNIENDIIENINKLYGYPDDSDVGNYIYGLYDIEIDWEYCEEPNTQFNPDALNYTVKLTLK